MSKTLTFQNNYAIIHFQEKEIKGASALCAHHSFDLSTGCVIDVMQCVFLGILAKTLMKFWVDIRSSSCCSVQYKEKGVWLLIVSFHHNVPYFS